jgi:hypothetical protein
VNLSERIGKMKEQRRYVRCKVSQGFFSGELYVVVAEPMDGEVSSAYVSADNVRLVGEAPKEGDVDGELLVHVIKETKDKALVEIPGQPVVGGLRSWIEKNAMVTA